jgi:hypothetical protein
MDVEPLCLEGSEAPGDGLGALTHRLKVVQSLLEAEIGEVIGDQLVAQEGDKLFVLLQEGILEIGAKDMVAVASLPCILACTRVPKISPILSAVSRHRPSSQLRSNSLWMGKWRLKMKLRQYSIWRSHKSVTS